MHDPTWAEGVRAVHADSGGLFEVFLIAAADVPEFFGAALAGDEQASRVLLTVADTVNKVRAAPRRTPILCLCCPKPVRKQSFTCGVALPARADPSHGLGFAVCQKCASTEILPGVLSGLRRFWPDLKHIPSSAVQREAGHA